MKGYMVTYYVQIGCDVRLERVRLSSSASVRRLAEHYKIWRIQDMNGEVVSIEDLID